MLIQSTNNFQYFRKEQVNFPLLTLQKVTYYQPSKIRTSGNLIKIKTIKLIIHFSPNLLKSYKQWNKKSKSLIMTSNS